MVTTPAPRLGDATLAHFRASNPRWLWVTRCSNFSRIQIYRRIHRLPALALFGAGLIQAMLGTVGWAMNSANFRAFDWCFSFSWVVLVELARRALRDSRRSAWLALGFYSGLLLVQWTQGWSAVRSGFAFFKAPVFALLLVAVVASCMGRGSPRQGLDRGSGY